MPKIDGNLIIVGDIHAAKGEPIFDVTAGANVTVSINPSTRAATISASAVSAAAFYLTAKHDDDSASFSGLNVIGFNTENFYLTQNDPNTDEVMVNFRTDEFAKGDSIARFFAASTEWQFNHNLNQRPVMWFAYDSQFRFIIPDSVSVGDPNTAYFYFLSNREGTAIVSEVGF